MVQFPKRPLSMAIALLIPVAAPAVPIFHSGFESGGVCAWSPPSGSDPCSRMFAHSGTNLYRVEPPSGETLIGAFNTGGPVVTDLAISVAGELFAVSATQLWSVSAATGAASLIAAIDPGSETFSSLAFVPLDGMDAGNGERLVMATSEGNVYQVNEVTGALMLLGNFGTSGGEPIVAAGDIVFVPGVGTFASVNVGDTSSDEDFLATVDPATWVATPLASSTGYNRLFGLGFWHGTVYGFVDNGSELGGTTISIDLTTGFGSMVGSSAVRWSGAAADSDVPLAGD